MVQNDPAFFRVAWYSGKYRPACRISQTGGGATALRFKTVSNEDWFFDSFMKQISS